MNLVSPVTAAIKVSMATLVNPARAVVMEVSMKNLVNQARAAAVEVSFVLVSPPSTTATCGTTADIPVQSQSTTVKVVTHWKAKSTESASLQDIGQAQSQSAKVSTGNLKEVLAKE